MLLKLSSLWIHCSERKLDTSFLAYKCIPTDWELHIVLFSPLSSFLIEEKCDALSEQKFLLKSVLGFFISNWVTVPAVQNKTER